jgi:hypothetical protein
MPVCAKKDGKRGKDGERMKKGERVDSFHLNKGLDWF